MKKASKIHKEFVGKTTPFRDWITVEKVHFGTLNNEESLDMAFDHWLDEKYKLNGRSAWLNAEGDVNEYNIDMLNKAQTGDKKWYDKAIGFGWLGINAYDRFKDITIETEQEQNELVDETDSANDEEVKLAKAKIFGLNKYVVYSVGIAVAVAGIYFLTKGKNNNN